jgi:putative ABC transport system permease protein
MARLWLRWSWRDLRRRWALVTAIALIIAIGAGVYAGFSSTSTWRRRSNDANYRALAMYDIRVRLLPGSGAATGQLADAVRAISDSAAIAGMEERLIVPVQVDASTDRETILVQGEMVGVDVSAGGPAVNRLAVQSGRGLEPADNGRRVVVLHPGFARQHGLPPSGTLRLTGDVPVEYVGQGLTPEYFVVTARAAGIIPLGNPPGYAVVFTSLATARAIAGQHGRVNDLVLRLAPGADRARVQREIEAAIAARLPDVSAAVTTVDDDKGYRMLYDDIDQDQRLISVLAGLVLAGAALATFNLTSRMVEAQRREIGVGMALGVRPLYLAIRPLLFGFQVALLGVLAGIPAGLLVGQAMKPVPRELLLLPDWQTPFLFGVYLRAALIALALPLIATAYPVWRAVRVEPVDAIRTGFLAGRSGGLAPLLRRLPLPGNSFVQLPLRNLVRTPRRTLLTAVAVAAAIAALVTTLGLIASFNAAIDQSAREVSRGSSDRLDIQLDGFYPLDAAPLEAISAATAVARATPGPRVEGIASAGGKEIGLQIDVLDFSGGIWAPAVHDRSGSPAGGGIILAEKAAGDLGVRPGEVITLRHPRRDGLGYRMVESRVRVAGLHGSPLRFAAYMDRDGAALFGLEGLSNAVQALPAPGASAVDVQRELFTRPGIAVFQPVNAVSEQLKDALAEFYDIFRIAEVAALAIALLIGFNATTIAADERAREHASMFAFGVPVRTTIRMNIIESALTGVLGTVAGIPAGYAVLAGTISRTVTHSFPDIGLTPLLSTEMVLIAVLVGVVAVAVGPLFTVRSLQRMDIPARLRVME